MFIEAQKIDISQLLGDLGKTEAEVNIENRIKRREKRLSRRRELYYVNGTNVKNRLYYLAHLEKYHDAEYMERKRIYVREYYRKNVDLKKAQNRRYYAENGEEINEARRERYANDTEYRNERREQNRLSYERNKEKRKAKAREYYQAHREEINARGREAYARKRAEREQATQENESK